MKLTCLPSWTHMILISFCCALGSVQSLSRVRLLATPWTAAHQAPPSIGFSRQEYWSGVPLLSCVQLLATPWTAAHQASLSFTISWSLLKLMSIESMMLSNHFILCCPLLLLPSICPTLRVFSNESVLCTNFNEVQFTDNDVVHV